MITCHKYEQIIYWPLKKDCFLAKSNLPFILDLNYKQVFLLKIIIYAYKCVDIFLLEIENNLLNLIALFSL